MVRANEAMDAASAGPLTLDAVHAELTAPGARFEMARAMIGGAPTRIWKNAPPDLAAVARLSRTHGGRLAMIHGDDCITYDAQFRAITALAEQLRTLGVANGDRVALAMSNLPEWPVAFFAIVSIGALCVPLNARWTAAELSFAIEDADATILIADGDRLQRLRDAGTALPSLRHILVARASEPPTGIARALEDVIGRCADYAALPDRPLPETPIAPDDDATIFYTSGTTGRPRGAVGTHRNLCTNILSSGYAAARTMLRRGRTPVSEPRVILLVVPLFHVTGCSAILMGAMATGSTIVLMPHWDAGEALRLIERERVQVTGGVPTVAWQLLDHPDRPAYDLSSLDTINYGGAPSAPELVPRIDAELGAVPGNGWGMTETMATVTQLGGPDYLARPTSCGQPVAVADLKIMTIDGSRELPTGEVGELWARGPMIVKGYWRQPDATAATFVDGWVRTGDLARLDAAGFCHIVDRLRDIVIRGGENIYSIEVENVLHAHPAVADAALIGMPDRIWGEQPVAIVHLRPGLAATEDELRDFVRSRLAGFKAPVAVRFVDAPLPRNAGGKIVKHALRATFGNVAA